MDPRRITIETDDRSGYHRIRAEGMTPVRGAGTEGAPDLPGIWFDQDHPVALADFGSSSELEGVSGRYHVDPSIPAANGGASWETSATFYWKPSGLSALATSLRDSLAIPDGRLVANPNTRRSPAIADIDDDGTYEAIVAGIQGVVYAWEIEYGSSAFAGTPKPQWPVLCSEEPGSPAVADLNDDGDQELLFVSADGLIHRFDLEGDDAPWPMAGYDVARTGFLERECGARLADGAVADRLALEAAPAATGSALRLSIPSDGDYEVRAYDVAGRLVRELFRGPLSSGQHEIIWSHQDDAAREVASGVYFLRVRRMGGNDEQATARSVIVR